MIVVKEKERINLPLEQDKWWATSLKIIRKSQQMTLTDVENLTGISKTYLSQLENGKHDVKLSTFEKITKALGYEINVVPTD